MLGGGVCTVYDLLIIVSLQDSMLKAWGWVVGYSLLFAAFSSASVAVGCISFSICVLIILLIN